MQMNVHVLKPLTRSKIKLQIVEEIQTLDVGAFTLRMNEIELELYYDL